MKKKEKERIHNSFEKQEREAGERSRREEQERRAGEKSRREEQERGAREEELYPILLPRRFLRLLFFKGGRELFSRFLCALLPRLVNVLAICRPNQLYIARGMEVLRNNHTLKHLTSLCSRKIEFEIC